MGSETGLGRLYEEHWIERSKEESNFLACYDSDPPCGRDWMFTDPDVSSGDDQDSWMHHLKDPNWVEEQKKTNDPFGKEKSFAFRRRLSAEWAAVVGHTGC